MAKRYFKFLAVALLLFVMGGCVYDFMPQGDDIQGLDKPLVVLEGDIIVGGITEISLKSSRSILDENSKSGIDFYGSSVWVESEDGKVWYGEGDFFEEGKFYVNTSDASLGGSYRLCVSVPGKGEYASSFKPVMISPAIDSVTYTLAQFSASLRVEVSTHNESTEPLYCKWSFREDWESNAEITPYLNLIRNGNNVVLEEITDEQQEVMIKCYSKAFSNDIYIADTEKLSKNVIFKKELNTIYKPSRKFSSMYAITVTQTAMDKEAYQYWSAVKAGISGTGGLFAPMPNEVRGNIVSTTTPDEIVLGYIGVSTATQARKFISAHEVMMFSITCEEAVYSNKDWPDVAGAGMLPIRYQETPEGDENKNAAYWTTSQCADCRRTSNSVRPDFWPEGR